MIFWRNKNYFLLVNVFPEYTCCGDILFTSNILPYILYIAKGLVFKRKLAFCLHFQLIKWADGPNNLEEIYDAVICADCLFFDEGRPQLLDCLKKALKPRGIAIVVAPSRSGTFEVSSRQYLWFSVFYVSIYSVVWKLLNFVQKWC